MTNTVPPDTQWAADLALFDEVSPQIRLLRRRPPIDEAGLQITDATATCPALYWRRRTLREQRCVIEAFLALKEDDPATLEILSELAQHLVLQQVSHTAIQTMALLPLFWIASGYLAPIVTDPYELTEMALDDLRQYVLTHVPDGAFIPATREQVEGIYDLTTLVGAIQAAFALSVSPNLPDPTDAPEAA